MPRVCLLTMRVLRRSISSRETWNFSTCTPILAKSLICLRALTECRMALVGMQPRCRQVPPRRSISTTAVFRPFLAAAIAPS